MSESVKAPETKAPAKKTQAVTEAKTEAVLYVGPTISGIAITGTVYTTIPEAAKAAKADAPMILNLFIPIREYGDPESLNFLSLINIILNSIVEVRITR